MVCMDVFIVDYGIESSDNVRDKRSNWVLNEPKIFFKATSLDHHLVCPIVPMRLTVVECRRQMFIRW